MAKIKVLVAEDHKLLRAGLRLLINTQSDMEVVGDAGSFPETLEIIRRLPPNVVTLDLSMPGGSGVKFIENLTREYPRVQVVVLTMNDDPAYFRMAMAAGASSYILKNAADTELFAAIRCVAGGRAFAQAKLTTGSVGALRGTPIARPSCRVNPFCSLSEREREVLEMVACGHTNQAIADGLFLSVKTVECYRSRLMAKLGLRNRAELTKFAFEVGILEPDSAVHFSRGHQEPRQTLDS